MAEFKSKGMVYIISRNAHKRPTLMHKMYNTRMTSCGVSTVGWSKSWFAEPITPLLCIRCKRIEGLK